MVVQLASPYDAERIKQMAAQKARFQPNPGPVAAQKPGMLETVGTTVGSNVLGKVGEAGMSKLGTLAKAKGTEMLAGLNTAGAPLGAMLPGGATAGAAGAGFMPMMAAAAPWLAGAAVLGKAFKLFNMGGLVGPLGNLSKVKYKTHGGDVTHEYEINMGPLSKGV